MPGQRPPGEGVRARVGQLDPVEGLRALAIALVIVFHYTVLRDPAANDPWHRLLDGWQPLAVIARNGYLGVDLFFLLTGFLLVMPWALQRLEGGPRPSVREFYRRRVRRIVPAYYVQLAFLFLLFLPLLHGLAYYRYNPGHIAYNGIAHALFLHYTTPLTSASFGINGPLWSLALEAQFYLLLPLLAPIFVRHPFGSIVIATAIAAAWRVLAMTDMEPIVRFQLRQGARWGVPEEAVRHLMLTQLPGYLAHFAAGMGLAMAWLASRRGHITMPEQGMWLAVAIAAALALYGIYGLGGANALGFTASWLATLTALACLVFAAARGLPERLKTPLLKPWLFVGRTSYSAYLYHVPLLLAWNHFGVLHSSGWSFPAYLSLVLVTSWASYRWVERPFMAR
ncbi:MAG TPA: acyltransferase [Usitatibacter sp.]|nr:acyltransferase [Usitatibacter sp.]